MTKSRNEIVEAIENVAEAIINDLDTNPTNDFGMTVGDELHSIQWQLSRIADSLEIIVKKFIDNK